VLSGEPYELRKILNQKGRCSVSEAKQAIGQSILTGMAKRNARHEINSADEAVTAVMECVFAKSVRWAVVAYLKELE